MEEYVESELKRIYPVLEIIFNNRRIIGLELDIYIPSLKLAFEINGIFHYKPVYGKVRMLKGQIRDAQRLMGCLERGIELQIINTESMPNFDIKLAKIFLDQIINIINHKSSNIIEVTSPNGGLNEGLLQTSTQSTGNSGIGIESVGA